MDDWYSEAEFEGGIPPAEIPSAQAQTHWYDILISGL